MSKKTNVIILLGIILAFSYIFTANLSIITSNRNKGLDYSDDNDLDNKNLRISAISGKIHIDNNWTAAKSAGICTGSGNYSDPYVIEDLIIDGKNSSNCILIENSNEFFRIENCYVYNSSAHSPPFYQAGIELKNVDNGAILNNNCSNNHGSGIFLYGSHNNTVSGNTAHYNSWYGIFSFSGINNSITGNSVINNGEIGIFSEYTSQTRITGNTVNNHSFYGIYLWGDSFNKVSRNALNHNQFGIYLFNSFDNNITGNTINASSQNGICLWGSNNTVISENTLNYNFEGISLTESSYNNIILNNSLSYHIFASIYSWTSSNNTISENTVIYNSNGIFLSYSNNNKILRNNVSNNNYKGISLSYSNKTLIYNNYLSGNTLNAFDNGTDNQWDNGAIGNYWNDYSGKDVNDDMVGDTPYSISGMAGSQDNYPIWWDPPLISINSPNVNETLESNPIFNISIDEGIVDTTWYTLDGGLTNYTFSGLVDFINQIAWDLKADGFILIKFYANDSLGYLGYKDINVIKDTVAPIISVIDPDNNDVFGKEAPTFELHIIEISIESSWYSLDGGITNITFTGLSGTINQNIWDNQPEGNVKITFFVKDGIGSIGIDSVLIIKSIPSKPEILGYNVFLIIGLISVVSIILLKKIETQKA